MDGTTEATRPADGGLAGAERQSAADRPGVPPALRSSRRARRARRRRQPSRQNYWLHILGGGGLLMAMQFGNPRLVLPWISQHLGVAYILVALLVPLFQAGLVISQLTAAPLVARLTLRKQLVAGMGMLLAGLFAVIFAVAAGLSTAIAALALLACAAIFGLTFGVFNVGNTDLLAKTVPARVRGRVLAQRVALGGVMTLGATFAVWAFLPKLAGNHLILLWLAVGAWIGAAVAYGAVRERPSPPPEVGANAISLKAGRALVARHPWYARQLIAGVMLQSVEMAVPFYAVHAASLHDPSARNLSAFVVAMALGLVLSGPIWGRLNDRHNALVAMAGCLLAAGAGVLVLTMDLVGDQALPFFHAFLFLPLSLARQGAIQARLRHLSVYATASDRPTMVAFNNALLAFAGICVALVLGAVGHLHDIRTPLALLIVANIAAALYARRAFRD
jgi:MFS family permease